MRKTAFLLLLLLFPIGLTGLAQAVSDDALFDVRHVVEEFGRRLAGVSLLSPPEVLQKEIQRQYKGLVSSELLSRWLAGEALPPGRVVSSPWPERIEIESMKALSEDCVRVRGSIVEVTSTGIVARQPIELQVEQGEESWLIASLALGSRMLVYRNGEYGFDFYLPESWAGYRVLQDTWESTELPTGGRETGPRITLRHPGWTETVPRQDIPILIFTQEQWTLVEAGIFNVGAAPIGPRKLGENRQYVFALPARYNFAFPEGFEEVEEILAQGPLHPWESQPMEFSVADPWNLPEPIAQWVEYSKVLPAVQERYYAGVRWVLITAGEKPTGGYRVQVREVIRHPDRIEIRYEITGPGPGDIVTTAITYPYGLIVLEDLFRPLEFTNVTAPEAWSMRVLGIRGIRRPIVAASEWIKLFSPAPGAEVGESIHLTGLANVFEGTVSYELKDSRGLTIAQGFTTATMGDWGYFEAEIPVPVELAGEGLVLEVYSESMKDGSKLFLVEVPLKRP